MASKLEVGGITASGVVSLPVAVAHISSDGEQRLYYTSDAETIHNSGSSTGLLHSFRNKGGTTVADISSTGLAVTGVVTTTNSIIQETTGTLWQYKGSAGGDAADEKQWWLQGGSGTGLGDGSFALRAVNDAGSSGINAITITRTGISSIDAINLLAPVTATGLATFSAGIDISSGFLTVGDWTSKTIAGGAITVTDTLQYVDTEGGAATDDLDTINGGESGSFLTLATPSSSRDVTLKDGTGNLILAGDFTLDRGSDNIMLVKEGNDWRELSRSNNLT